MLATGPKLLIPVGEDLTAPVEGTGIQIEYPAELMDRIRAETVSAFMSLPHGGLEIAGLLFGTRTGRTLYLAAARPIACEHAGGPSFILSTRDEDRLETLLADCRTDPELEGLEALGWYVSHTRRAPTLTPADAAIFDRFFAEPQQVTGVVQPEASGAAQFRWFVRNDDGTFDRQQPSYEFTVNPPAAVPPLRSLEKIDHAPAKAPTVALAHPTKRVRVSNLGLALTGLVLLSLAAGMLWWTVSRPMVVHAPPLHVLDTGTQLRIDWDPKSPAVQAAKAGVLQIKDSTGSPVRLNLSSDMIRTGTVLYNKPSSKVEVLLQLQDDKGGVTTSMVYFIGQEQAAAAVKPLPAAIPEHPSTPPPQKSEPVTVVSSGSADRAIVRFRPPVARNRAAVPAEPVLIEPPKIAANSTIPANLVGTAPLATLRPDPDPPPPGLPEPSAPRAKAPAMQPASGRLIWTGELRKNAVLHITDRSASAGSLNGTLPGQPVKITVRPAELLDGAIAIYTSDSSGNSKAEAPSRRNGWNVTLYKFDPKRAHDLAVIEKPAQNNNWKLGIKSVNRPVSMIVIDWQTNPAP